MAVARNLQEEAVKNAGQGTYVSDAQRQAQAKVQSYGDNPYAVFQESAKTKNAYNQLQNTLNNRPEDYTSNYTDTINNLLDQIVNRKEFSYDFNADPLYQAYKNQYTTAGKQAMKDTVAQTSAMTGGYGNSYSTTAGSQAYQGYLQQLNDRIPELYAQALNKYQMEGEELRNKYNVVGQQEDREYGKWTDKMDFWDRDRTFGLNQYNNFWDQDMREQAFNSDNWKDSRDFDYGRYRDIVGDDRYSYENSYKALKDAQDFDYQQARDAVGDQRWLDEFAYQQARDKVKDNQWAMEFALQQAKAAASGGRGGSSGKSSGNTSGNTYKAGKSGSGGARRDAEMQNSDAYRYAESLLNNPGNGGATSAANFVGSLLARGSMTLDEAGRMMDLLGINVDDIDWDSNNTYLKYFDKNMYR
jgi:hypothetical protein